MRTALVLGATGLVGQQLVRQLLNDPYFTLVKVFVRRSMDYVDPKLEERIIDFEKPEEWRSELIGDVLFSAFGTTLKQAGGQAAQYKIDYHYQFLVARLAAENGVPDCVLVSSPGAHPGSKVFYTRMKGELDRDVAKLGFDRLVLIKPSILQGDRTEPRLGESFGIHLMRLLSWIPGIRRYRPIAGAVVAQAMIYAYKNPGEHPIMDYSLDTLFEMK